MGREYLSNLRENASRARERQTRARAVSFQMHRLFMPLDEEVSCRLMENGKMMLDIAHLIDRKCVERYQNKFVTTSAVMRECQMQLSGPWPPYHFVHRLTRTAHAQPQPTAAAVPACCGRSAGGSHDGAGGSARVRAADSGSIEELQLRLKLFCQLLTLRPAPSRRVQP